MSSTSRIAATTHPTAALSDGTDGWIVATSFGDPAREATACRTSIAVADVSHWGTFRLSGANSVKFLQGLVTNDIAALAPGEGCYAAFLNVHGRIEADVHVFRFDTGLVLHTPPEATNWVETNLGRFRMAGGFDLERLDPTHAMISVIGPQARQCLADLLGTAVPGHLECAETTADDVTLSMLGVRRATSDSVDVLGTPGPLSELWKSLVDAGAVPAGSEALEIVRLEAGIARFGRDFDSDVVLQELDCPEIVSFQKGCYLGQEIVARLHFQGQPSKLLRRLEIANGTLPDPGDDVVSTDDPAKSAGRVTSVSDATVDAPTVFALVKRRFYEPGTPVRIRHGESLVDAVVAPRRPTVPTEESE